MKYYPSQHISTCRALWKLLGTKSVYVCSIEDATQGYATKTILVWANLEAWRESRQRIDDENARG
jgi:hypothetical protein